MKKKFAIVLICGILLGITLSHGYNIIAQYLASQQAAPVQQTPFPSQQCYEYAYYGSDGQVAYLTRKCVPIYTTP